MSSMSSFKVSSMMSSLAGRLISGRVRLLARSRFQSRRSRSMLSLAHRLAVDVRCRRRLVGRVVCLAMLHVLDARAVDVNVSPLSLHLDFQVPLQGFSILFMWPCCMSSMLGPWTTRVHTRTFVIRLSCGRPRTRVVVSRVLHILISAMQSRSRTIIPMSMLHIQSRGPLCHSRSHCCNHCQCPFSMYLDLSTHIRCQCLSMLHIQSRGPCIVSFSITFASIVSLDLCNGNWSHLGRSSLLIHWWVLYSVSLVLFTWCWSLSLRYLSHSFLSPSIR